MIFFDLDDTLMDFKKAEYLGINAFYNQFFDKLKHSEEEFHSEWGRIGQIHFERYMSGELTFEQQKIARFIDLLSDSDLEVNQDNAINYFQIYVNHYEDNWQIFDDAIPCLELLKDSRLGIITNGDSVQQRQKLKKIGIQDYFEVVMVSGDIGISKPHSDIFIKACELAQVNPSNCFFVGDNFEVDILGCEKVNMKGIWLNRNNDKRHTRTIKSLSELKASLDSEFGNVADSI